MDLRTVFFFFACEQLAVVFRDGHSSELRDKLSLSTFVGSARKKEERSPSERAKIYVPAVFFFLFFVNIPENFIDI